MLSENSSRDEITDKIKETPSCEKCVVIIDDEYEIREFMRFFIQTRGYTCLVFENTHKFEEYMLEHTNIEHIRLMIVDKDMPGMSGAQFVNNNSDKLKGVPKILCSGNRSVEDSAELFGAVMDKPFDLMELLEKIKELDRYKDDNQC